MRAGNPEHMIDRGIPGARTALTLNRMLGVWASLDQIHQHMEPRQALMVPYLSEPSEDGMHLRVLAVRMEKGLFPAPWRQGVR